MVIKLPYWGKSISRCVPSLFVDIKKFKENENNKTKALVPPVSRSVFSSPADFKFEDELALIKGALLTPGRVHDWRNTASRCTPGEGVYLAHRMGLIIKNTSTAPQLSQLSNERGNRKSKQPFLGRGTVSR